MTTEYIILNENVSSLDSEEEAIQDPLLLSKNLIKLMKNLKGQNFLDEKTIDYVNLCKSELYLKDFMQLTYQLKQIDLNLLLNSNDDTNDQNLLAFFIIAYLSNQCDGNTPEGNLLTQLEGKFWSKMAYIIGKDNEAFSLDDIEHGVLRANRVHPSRKVALFSENDARKKYAVKNFDPRIHFALNCGAMGCPPISFYTVENLDRGLEMATNNFLNSETHIDLNEKLVRLSKLFLWYKTDFIGQDDEILLIEYITSHLKKDEIKYEQLKNLMFHDNERLVIEYTAYDWNINAKI